MNRKILVITEKGNFVDKIETVATAFHVPVAEIERAIVEGFSIRKIHFDELKEVKNGKSHSI